MKYYVVGRLQHTTSDEVVDVSVVEGARYWEDAAVQAGNTALAKAGETGGRWPYSDVEAFGDWNYWLMAVVELSPGLPVRYEGNETNMPGVEEAGRKTKGPRTVVIAFDTDSGNTLVQKMKVENVKPDALRAVRELMDPEEVYSMYGGVMEQPDGSFVILTGEEPSAVLPPEEPGSAHPAGLLERVNRDRAGRGQRELAPGEWSTSDREEFARHVRNPAHQDLKRRLMR